MNHRCISTEPAVHLLWRIEAGRQTGAPTRIVADRSMKDDKCEAALLNGRVRVAKGKAAVRNGVLWTVSPAMTAEAWAARHVAPH